MKKEGKAFTMLKVLFIYVFSLLIIVQAVGGSKAILHEIESLTSSETNVLDFASGNTYKRFVRAKQRDYDFFILFTASEKVGCTICDEWEHAFVEAAQAAKGQLSQNSSVYFGIARFERAQDAFAIYSLQHAPIVSFFAREAVLKGKIDPRTSLDLSSISVAFPDPIANFITKSTGQQVEIKYSPWPRITAVSLVTLFSIAFGRQMLLLAVPIARNAKWLWFTLSIFLYGVGVSGSIYSYLTNAPKFGTDPETGKPMYFSDEQTQYLYEGLIVWAMLILAGAFLVGSITSLSWLKGWSAIQVLLQVASIVGFWSICRLYLSFYVQKAQWYAYSLGGDTIAQLWIPAGLVDPL